MLAVNVGILSVRIPVLPANVSRLIACIHFCLLKGFSVWQLIKTLFWVLYPVGSASHHTAAFRHFSVVC